MVLVGHAMWSPDLVERHEIQAAVAMYSIWVLKFVVAVLLVPQMNGELVSIPEIGRFAVSMIPTNIGIYLALHADKLHDVGVVSDVVGAVAVDAVVVARNHSMRHSHRMLRIQHYVANHTSATHDYTSVRPYSFLTKLRQTHKHNIASNHLDADNIQILLDTRRRQTLQNLLDLRPTIWLL